MFGGNDRELLHQILRELGELRERVTSQQQAIDQTRQDTTAAITTGLAEIRAVVRDGLHRHHETIGDPLTRINTELISIRAALNDLTRERQQPTPAETQPDDTQPATGPHQPDTDTELLQAAAGISHAELRMHRDTWAFLVEHAAEDRHFHLPGKVDDHGGAVLVHVSGPSMVAALTSLAEVSQTAAEPGTRAIAGHIHARFVETVEEILTRPHRGEGADPVRIIIDDRAKPDSDKQ